jgi:hypothetical protein
MPQYVVSPFGGRNTAMMMLIARYGMHAVLDPTAKLLYVKTNWDANYYNYAEAAIKEVVRLLYVHSELYG